MRINFRHGFVVAPAGFLTAGANQVNLNVSPGTEIVATIADGVSNYLITERESITGAWTGITAGVNRWIYIDLHPVTGSRTFGSTLLSPVVGLTAPVAPANDQHWYDTGSNTMKVWVALGNKWVRKVRVFAALMQGGTVPISVSANAPLFTGTQIGNTTQINAGSLLYDDAGVALKKSTGQFFTTEDSAVAVDGSNAQVKFNSQVILATAQGNIPAYSVVKFSDFNKVALGTNFVISAGRYGFTEGQAATGEAVQVLIDGVVTNIAWDWSAAEVGSYLYVDGTGQLTLTPTGALDPIAFVLSPTTVILRPSSTFGVRVEDDAFALDDLTDVTITTPVGGQVLSYNGTTWINAAASSSIDTLDELTDVVIATPQSGEALIYNGSTWANASIPASSIDTLDELTDVTITTPQTNDVLSYNGTTWVNTVPSSGVDTLDELTDVTITTPQNGEVLAYSGGTWVNTSAAATNLDGLSDVVITGPQSTEVLAYNGSSWVNTANPTPTNTDDLTEGSTNQYFTMTRVRDTVLTVISFLVSTAITATDTVLQAFGKLQAQLTAHTTDINNPHAVTKTQVGLSNVDNTSDANKPISIATQSALDDKASLTTAQTFTASQKTGIVTDNDLAIDLTAAGNDYSITPTGAGTLTFANIASNTGKSGNIIFVNTGNYAIAKGANILCPATLFTTISSTGDYWISYHCSGAFVRLSASGANV